MAEVLKYVDPGDTGSLEDGSDAEPYINLVTFESNEQADLVAAGDHMRCLCRTTGSNPEDSAGEVVINGWTLSATNYLQIEADRGEATGKYTGDLAYSTSHYRLTSSGFDVIDIRENDSRIDGLQVRVSKTGNNIDALALSGDRIILKKTRINGDDNSGNSCKGIAIASGAELAEVTNNLVFGFDGGADSAGIWWDQGAFNDDGWIYHNTVFGCSIGIHLASGTNAAADMYVVNNCLYRHTNDYQDDTAGADVHQGYNAGDDADITGATGGQNIGDTDGELDDEMVDPTTADNENADANPNDTGSLLYDNAIAAGDATWDPDSKIPSDDINDVTRSTDEIGCFAFVASGSTFEESISLALDMSYASAAAVTFEGAVSLGIQKTFAQTGDATFEPSVSMGPEMQAALAADVTFEPAVSMAAELAIATTAAVTFEPSITLTTNLSISEADDISLEESISLGLIHGVSPAAQIDFGPAISVGLSFALTLANDITFEGDVSVGVSFTQGTTAEVTFEPSVLLALQNGLTATGAVTAEESIALALRVAQEAASTVAVAVGFAISVTTKRPDRTLATLQPGNPASARADRTVETKRPGRVVITKRPDRTK